MKHIKKFNEELKSDTYYSAANKFGASGHHNRAIKLRNYGSDVEVRELEEKERIQKEKDQKEKEKKYKEWQENIKKFSPFGLFKIKIDELVQDYYLKIDYNSDMFLDNDFMPDSRIYMNFSVSIIPPDVDSYNKLKELDYDFDEKTDYIHMMFRIDVITELSKFDSEAIKFNLYYADTVEGVENVQIADRRSAYKFKKLFRSLFTSKEYPTSGYWATKYKSVYNHIDLSLAESGVSSDFGLTMEDIVLAIDKTPINSLYSN
jgi:hypothetical protein